MGVTGVVVDEVSVMVVDTGVEEEVRGAEVEESVYGRIG